MCFNSLFKTVNCIHTQILKDVLLGSKNIQLNLYTNWAKKLG